MKCVQITDGVYGYRKEGSNRVRPVGIGGIVEVPDEEAERLVALKVAKYYGLDEATEAAISETSNQTGTDNDNGGTNGVTGNDNGGTDGVTGNDNGKSSAAPDGSASPATQLMKMKIEELQKLTADMGIDNPKLKAKKDFVNAIIQATADNGDIL